MNEITLHQPPTRAWGTPNLSPFCIKLETYLRMADIPYRIDSSGRLLRRAPWGKVPYIELDGKLMSDSSRIIAHLKERLGDTVDGHLDDTQHALGHLVQRTLEEGTYWSLLYVRWCPDANFEIVRDALFSHLPALRWVVPDLVRRRVLGALYAQGTSRHDPAWIYASAARDVDAVSRQLGDRPYLFGDTPSTYDAIIYAFSASIWKTPFAKNFGAAPANLQAHLARMHARYFPELARKQ